MVRLFVLLKKFSLKIFLGIVGLFILGWGTILFLFLTEPTSLVENVLLTNISDHQVTISWTTSKPTRGGLIISENGKFPFTPFFIKDLKRDDREKGLLKMGFYNTHQVTINNLKDKTGYQYLIYQGWKKVYLAGFTTGATLASLSNPNPVYGQILKPDKKTPAQGVLVYLHAENEGSKSATLSTLTNSQGRWSIDLGNLRTGDLTKEFLLNTKTKEVIIAQTGNKTKFKAQTNPGQDKPWPDTILTKVDLK